MPEKYAPLFDRHETEVGTLVAFPNGPRVLSTDPQTYRKLEHGGYKRPPRIWPLFDAEGQQVTVYGELVSGSQNREEAA
jgi:hypothetical protein